MNHSFIPSLVEKGKCGKCNFPMLAHTKLATCEACNAKGEVDVYYGNMLMCSLCSQKEKLAWEESQKPENQESRIKYVKDTYDIAIEKAKEIDNSIKYSGDVFNAETVAIATLKSTIDSNESLSSSEKVYKLQELVLERIEKYKTVIFKLDDKKHELVAKQQAAIVSLREYGNQLRTDIREKLKIADANYQPAPAVKIPKITKPKVSPFDRMIEALALSKGISKGDAEQLLKKGGLI